MKLIQVGDTVKNKGHYSAGVISGNLLYISGQLSIDLYTREVINAC